MQFGLLQEDDIAGLICADVRAQVTCEPDTGVWPSIRAGHTQHPRVMQTMVSVKRERKERQANAKISMYDL